MSRFIDHVLFIGLIGLFALGFFMLIIFIPLSFRAEARCLEKSYPKARVTWNLRTYCIGYDGMVHPVVVEDK